MGDSFDIYGDLIEDTPPQIHTPAQDEPATNEKKDAADLIVTATLANGESDNDANQPSRPTTKSCVPAVISNSLTSTSLSHGTTLTSTTEPLSDPLSSLTHSGISCSTLLPADLVKNNQTPANHETSSESNQDDVEPAASASIGQTVEMNRNGDFELMNDVYSLHTEKEKEHKKELFNQQLVIDQLHQDKERLQAENIQLKHNNALLLVTARKELQAQKQLVLTLRKQLVQRRPNFQVPSQVAPPVPLSLTTEVPPMINTRIPPPMFTVPPPMPTHMLPMINTQVPPPPLPAESQVSHMRNDMKQDTGTFNLVQESSSSHVSYPKQSACNTSRPQEPSITTVRHKESSVSSSRHKHSPYKTSRRREPSVVSSRTRETSSSRDVRGLLMSRTRVDKAKDNLRQREKSVLKDSGRKSSRENINIRYKKDSCRRQGTHDSGRSCSNSSSQRPSNKVGSNDSGDRNRYGIIDKDNTLSHNHRGSTSRLESHKSHGKENVDKEPCADVDDSDHRTTHCKRHYPSSSDSPRKRRKRSSMSDKKSKVHETKLKQKKLEVDNVPPILDSGSMGELIQMKRVLIDQLEEASSSRIGVENNDHDDDESNHAESIISADGIANLGKRSQGLAMVLDESATSAVLSQPEHVEGITKPPSDLSTEPVVEADVLPLLNAGKEESNTFQSAEIVKAISDKFEGVDDLSDVLPITHVDPLAKHLEQKPLDSNDDTYPLAANTNSSTNFPKDDSRAGNGSLNIDLGTSSSLGKSIRCNIECGALKKGSSELIVNEDPNISSPNACDGKSETDKSAPISSSAIGWVNSDLDTSSSLEQSYDDLSSAPSTGVTMFSSTVPEHSSGNSRLPDYQTEPKIKQTAVHEKKQTATISDSILTAARPIKSSSPTSEESQHTAEKSISMQQEAECSSLDKTVSYQSSDNMNSSSSLNDPSVHSASLPTKSDNAHTGGLSLLVHFLQTGELRPSKFMAGFRIPKKSAELAANGDSEHSLLESTDSAKKPNSCTKTGKINVGSKSVSSRSGATEVSNSGGHQESAMSEFHEEKQSDKIIPRSKRSVKGKSDSSHSQRKVDSTRVKSHDKQIPRVIPLDGESVTDPRCSSDKDKPSVDLLVLSWKDGDPVSPMQKPKLSKATEKHHNSRSHTLTKKVTGRLSSCADNSNPDDLESFKPLLQQTNSTGEPVISGSLNRIDSLKPGSMSPRISSMSEENTDGNTRRLNSDKLDMFSAVDPMKKVSSRVNLEPNVLSMLTNDISKQLSENHTKLNVSKECSDSATVMQSKVLEGNSIDKEVKMRALLHTSGNKPETFTSVLDCMRTPSDQTFRIPKKNSPSVSTANKSKHDDRKTSASTLVLNPCDTATKRTKRYFKDDHKAKNNSTNSQVSGQHIEKQYTATADTDHCEKSQNRIIDCNEDVLEGIDVSKDGNHCNDLSQGENQHEDKDNNRVDDLSTLLGDAPNNQEENAFKLKQLGTVCVEDCAKQSISDIIIQGKYYHVDTDDKSGDFNNTCGKNTNVKPGEHSDLDKRSASKNTKRLDKGMSRSVERSSATKYDKSNNRDERERSQHSDKHGSKPFEIGKKEVPGSTFKDYGQSSENRGNKNDKYCSRKEDCLGSPKSHSNRNTKYGKYEDSSRRERNAVSSKSDGDQGHRSVRSRNSGDLNSLLSRKGDLPEPRLIVSNRNRNQEKYDNTGTKGRTAVNSTNDRDRSNSKDVDKHSNRNRNLSDSPQNKDGEKYDGTRRRQISGVSSHNERDRGDRNIRSRSKTRRNTDQNVSRKRDLSGPPKNVNSKTRDHEKYDDASGRKTTSVSSNNDSDRSNKNVHNRTIRNADKHSNVTEPLQNCSTRNRNREGHYDSGRKEKTAVSLSNERGQDARSVRNSSGNRRDAENNANWKRNLPEPIRSRSPNRLGERRGTKRMRQGSMEKGQGEKRYKNEKNSDRHSNDDLNLNKDDDLSAEPCGNSAELEMSASNDFSIEQSSELRDTSGSSRRETTPTPSKAETSSNTDLYPRCSIESYTVCSRRLPFISPIKMNSHDQTADVAHSTPYTAADGKSISQTTNSSGNTSSGNNNSGDNNSGNNNSGNTSSGNNSSNLTIDSLITPSRQLITPTHDDVTTHDDVPTSDDVTTHDDITTSDDVTNASEDVLNTSCNDFAATGEDTTRSVSRPDLYIGDAILNISLEEGEVLSAGSDIEDIPVMSEHKLKEHSPRKSKERQSNQSEIDLRAHLSRRSGKSRRSQERSTANQRSKIGDRIARCSRSNDRSQVACRSGSKKTLEPNERQNVGERIGRRSRSSEKSRGTCQPESQERPRINEKQNSSNRIRRRSRSNERSQVAHRSGSQERSRTNENQNVIDGIERQSRCNERFQGALRSGSQGTRRSRSKEKPKTNEKQNFEDRIRRRSHSNERSQGAHRVGPQGAHRPGSQERLRTDEKQSISDRLGRQPRSDERSKVAHRSGSQERTNEKQNISDKMSRRSHSNERLQGAHRSGSQRAHRSRSQERSRTDEKQSISDRIGKQPRSNESSQRTHRSGPQGAHRSGSQERLSTNGKPNISERIGRRSHSNERSKGAHMSGPQGTRRSRSKEKPRSNEKQNISDRIRDKIGRRSRSNESSQRAHRSGPQGAHRSGSQERSRTDEKQNISDRIGRQPRSNERSKVAHRSRSQERLRTNEKPSISDRLDRRSRSNERLQGAPRSGPQGTRRSRSKGKPRSNEKQNISDRIGDKIRRRSRSNESSQRPHRSEPQGAHTSGSQERSTANEKRNSVIHVVRKQSLSNERSHTVCKSGSQERPRTIEKQNVSNRINRRSRSNERSQQTLRSKSKERLRTSEKENLSDSIRERPGCSERSQVAYRSKSKERSKANDKQTIRNRIVRRSRSNERSHGTHRSRSQERPRHSDSQRDGDGRARTKSRVTK